MARSAAVIFVAEFSILADAIRLAGCNAGTVSPVGWVERAKSAD